MLKNSIKSSTYFNHHHSQWVIRQPGGNGNVCLVAVSNTISEFEIYFR